MKSRKFSEIWKNIRPAVIVFTLIIAVIVVHNLIKPSKIDSIEQTQYKDTITRSTLADIKHTAHLHQVPYHHDRYTGIAKNVVYAGPHKNLRFELDYYKSRNILDFTPIGKTANRMLTTEPVTHSKKKMANATYIEDGILEYDSSFRKQVSDPHLGVQLTAHTKSHHIPILFSVNNNKSEYNVLKVGKLVQPKGLF